MNYLDALMVQTTALRKVMKEPARSEALGRSSFKYREFSYADGKEMPSGACEALRRRTKSAARPLPPLLRPSADLPPASNPSPLVHVPPPHPLPPPSFHAVEVLSDASMATKK